MKSSSILLIVSCTLMFYACEPVEPDIDTGEDSQSDTTVSVDTQTDVEVISNTLSCSSLQTQFNETILPTLNSTCAVCHGSSGVHYSTVDFKFSSNNAFTDILSYNLDDTKQLWMLEKPSGIVGHDGGNLIGANQSLTDDFAQFVNDSQSLNQSCQSSAIVEIPTSASIANVELLSLKDTYKRARLLFTGQYPADAELDAVVDISSYKLTLNTQLSGEDFTEFLMVGANDKLLTQKFSDSQTFALDQLNGWTYPGLYDRLGQSDEARDQAQKAYQDAYDLLDENDIPTGWNERREYLETNHGEVYALLLESERLNDQNWQWRLQINFAIAQEPLRLIDFVVQNERPYSEILTADYMMVNGFSNEIWNGDFKLDGLDFEDKDTWRQGYIARHKNIHLESSDGYEGQTQMDSADTDQNQFAQTAHVPSAGILTSPSFLLRFPSTQTNKNRARAKWAYDFFLGVDIERLVQRAQDPEELASVLNPNTAGASCLGCHEIMDPVAGAFQSFGDNGEYLTFNGSHSLYGGIQWDDEHYEDGDRWYRLNIAPGFNGTDINSQNKYGPMEDRNDFVDPIQWLAHQIVEDPRFASGTVKFWYPAVFSQNLLHKPTATEDLNYSALNAAFERQELMLADLAQGFAEDNLNLKTLLIDMTLTDHFRAEQFTNSNDSRSDEIAQIGVGRLLTPEQLDKKFTSLTGQYWTYNWSPQTNRLIEDYNLFLGGIDSNQIAERAREVNSMMLQVIDRMAQEITCKLVVDEFNTPVESRMLLDLVNVETVPSIPEDWLTGYFQGTDNWEITAHDNFENTMKAAADNDPEAIRLQITQLMNRFFNQSYESNNTEVDALVELWTDVWQGRIDAGAQIYVTVDRDNVEHGEYCDVSWNTLEQGFSNVGNSEGGWGNYTLMRSELGAYFNPEQTVRAWSAVLNYLMTDFEFIYQ